MTDTTNPDAACSPSGDPYLLTPGPLTTSLTVKQAMLHDYGSRDATFIDLNARILDRLVAIVNGVGSHVSVPLQGSGTFVVEAMIGNFVPADGRLLILINGAYGKRIAKICDYYRRDYLVQETPEDVPVDTAQLVSLVCLVVIPFATASVVPAWRAATSDPYEALRGAR